MQIFPNSMTLDLPVTQSLIKITSQLNVGGGGGGGGAGLGWGKISDVEFLVSGFWFFISGFSFLTSGSWFWFLWFLVSDFSFLMPHP